VIVVGWGFSVSPSVLLLLFFAWLPLAVLMALPVQEVGAPIILGSIPLILLWYGWRRHLSSLAFLTSFYPLSLLLYLVRDSIPPSVIGFIISSMFLIPAYFDNFEKNLWRLYTLLFTLTFSLTNFDLKVGVFILALGVVLIIKVESPKNTGSWAYLEYTPSHQ